MNRFDQPKHHLSGFTLLELCIVLFIMALMTGAAVPTLRSAFIEQTLRNDSNQVAQLVKNAMLASDEQRRLYMIRMTGRTLSLEPVMEPGALPDADDNSTSGGVTTVKLEHVLKFSEGEGKKDWDAPHSATWQFEPNGLCPVPRVRLEDGSASLEMSFNALTGDIEDDSLSIP